mmetsp:Transcript_6894/g.15735  ORF Transcript_6894/g.15735 Transcript_6894/m.15735 type:complete len:223 (+) Transcript_6894:209-877(+)
MASFTGRPSGKDPLGPPTSPFNFASSRSTSLAPSSAANFCATASPDVSWPTASARASVSSTFSSMRSNAARALEPSIVLLSRPCVFSAVFAACTRALSVSFFAFASVTFCSSVRVLLRSFSTASDCCTTWFSSASACSLKFLCRVSASLASSSSPLETASCARLYQSSLCVLAAVYFASICFLEAMTCAVACRIFTRSSCISMTVCSSIFSGSSALLRIELV